MDDSLPTGGSVVLPTNPPPQKPRTNTLQLLIAVLVLVVLGAGGWWYYTHHQPSTLTQNSQTLQTLPGELDFYTRTSLPLAENLFASGVLEYTSATGLVPLVPQTPLLTLNSPTLSPLRDEIAYVTQSTSSATTHGSIVSLYSLVTKKSSPVAHDANPILNVIWSGDASTLAYLQLSQVNGTSTLSSVKLSVDGKNVKNIGPGIPIALSYDGTQILYSTPAAQLYITSSTTPGISVSDKLSFASTTDVASPISVAVSPDRQYVAILGSTKTFVAQIDWAKNTLLNPTMLNTAYAAGVFNQKNELLLAKTGGIADLYTPGATDFTKGTSYTVPKVGFLTTFLGWVSTTP